jgi:hypothetical protein
MRSVTSKPATKTTTATAAAATAEIDDELRKWPRIVRAAAPVARPPAIRSGSPIEKLARTPSTIKPPAAAARNDGRTTALHRRASEAASRAAKAARYEATKATVTTSLGAPPCPRISKR